jgi:DNA-binding MarR family transcriptional regulator
MSTAGSAARGSGEALVKAQIVRSLMAIGDRAKRIVATTLRDYGAASSTADVLWALASGDDPATPRDIAVRLARDPSTVSLAVDKLEQANLVVRQPHPTDGRKRTLVLTERGADLWAVLTDRLHDADLLSGLDREDLCELAALLTKLH